MKPQTRRKVSYVIRQHDSLQAHCLGVNSLAIDTHSLKDMSASHATGGILYSAGRDGVVAGWDLHMTFKPSFHADSVANDDAWKPDRQVKATSSATCNVFTQMHTDWVNDIVVCDNGQAVVSASSDRSIKVWRPFSSEGPLCIQTIGWHTDYAKCLACAHGAGWVASGGLDRKVMLWDLKSGQATTTIHTNPTSYNNESTTTDPSHSAGPKASVYALAVDPAGSLLATGSPEKVVRLWDPRSGKRTGKLTGHTDNIRALLMSDDGQLILSGSSDSTIKLWSVKAQRCLATYETHPDSVWALYSDHPHLRTFYAGSRDGLVTRTEISGEDTDGENECIGLFREKKSISKIVALADTYVWTATSDSCIRRWLSVPPRDSRTLLRPSDLNPEIPASAIVRLPPVKTTFHPVIDHFVSNDSHTLYAGSVMSIPIEYGRNTDDAHSAESIVPLRDQPDEIIGGKAGITSHEVLHNRRHILTKDTDGEVALWDLVKFEMVKKYGQVDLNQKASDLMNGMDIYPSWCSIDTKIGAITIQLGEDACFDCEMYADELNLDGRCEVREDQRLNLGKWVLASLFAGFIQSKRARVDDASTRETDHQQNGQPLPTPGVHRYPTTPSPLKLPLTAMTTAHLDSSPFPPSQDTMFSGPLTAPPTSSQFDYFSPPHSASPHEATSNVQLPPATASLGTNFIGRLKNLSVKGKPSRSQLENGDETTPSSQDADGQLRSRTDTAKTTTTTTGRPGESSSHHGDGHAESTHYTPPDLSEFPPLSLPASTPILFTEESVEASTGMDLYRGTVGSVATDADVIMHSAPSWLLEFLLYNKTPTKDTLKLTFVVRPAPGTELKELPGGPNNRLLANRILRVRKLAVYISEKLGIEADQLEILFGTTLLTPTMTLSGIRQHLLKSDGDIVLSYRLLSEGDKVSTRTA